MSTERPIFARALPEAVSVMETYRCKQVISQRPSSSMVEEPPRGELEVAVPYDGGTHFSRAAIRDVMERCSRIGLEGEQAEAQIGHLLFDGTERTDIDRLLSTANRFGAVPLRVPVSPGEEDLDAFLGHDKQEAVFHLEYAPSRPDTPPVHVRMELVDADEMSSTRWLTLREEELLQNGEAANAMRRLPERRGFLLLLVVVRVELPADEGEYGDAKPDPRTAPTITGRLEIEWPTVPAPGSVRLHGVQPVGQEGGVASEGVDVPYDLRTRSLRCPWVELHPKRGRRAAGAAHPYETGFLFLEIHHGGDLYGERCLRGRVEVEVEGRLLSGLRVGVFDAVGVQHRAERSYCRTRVVADVSLDLDDAVRTWTRSPVQHLRFDQVVLDEMRIHDVRKALEDRGFRVRLPMDRLLVAEKPEGARQLRLWVYLEGDTFSTVRRTEAPGGQTFTTKLRSGCLSLYLRGQLQGSAGPVLDEIHGLHERLRHQFLATTDRR